MTVAHAQDEGPTIRISKRRPFSAVPDDVLTDHRLGDRAARLLAWLVGRPDGWDIRVAPLRRLFRLSEPQWRSARRELEAAGYFIQRRLFGLDGKIRWEHEVNDVGIPSDENGGMDPSPSKPSDGLPSDGNNRDIAVNRINHSKEAVVAAAVRKSPPGLLHGVRCWNESDFLRTTRLIEREGADAVAKASDQLQLASGKIPLPTEVENYFARVATEHRQAKNSNELLGPQEAVAAPPAVALQRISIIRQVMKQTKGISAHKRSPKF